MILICVLFGFSLTKAFLRTFYSWSWSEIRFCENVGDEVLLQPLIMSKRTCFVLSGVAFLIVKNVLDFWYSSYFLFLAVRKLWKHQEEKAS